ncbi:MAG: hypothetical protein CMI29_06830 [Opitutae bacterium]|nr:hypothetical protein [Opitutae bacterium]
MNIHGLFFVEVVAMRTWQFLNGCSPLDAARENCLVHAIRLVAPALRASCLLTGLYLIILNRFFQSWPLIFRYSLLPGNGSITPDNVTLYACMILWALDFVFLAVACAYTWSHSKRNWWLWTCGFRLNNELLTVFCTLFFAVYAAVGIIWTHTALTHMWHVRNPWFAALLGLQCVTLVVASLGDAIDIGSPRSAHHTSRVASVLLSLRLGVLVPVTVIFSVAAVFASWRSS